MLTSVQLLEPRKGAIALDANGLIGLILSEDGDAWDHNDNEEKVVGWDGIHLTPEVMGERWFCTTPTVIGYADTVTDILARYVHGSQVMSAALDSIWELMYPNSNGDWEYPGQVAAHIRNVLEEVHHEPRQRAEGKTSSGPQECAPIEEGNGDSPTPGEEENRPLEVKIVELAE